MEPVAKMICAPMALVGVTIAAPRDNTPDSVSMVEEPVAKLVSTPAIPVGEVIAVPCYDTPDSVLMKPVTKFSTPKAPVRVLSCLVVGFVGIVLRRMTRGYWWSEAFWFGLQQSLCGFTLYSLVFADGEHAGIPQPGTWPVYADQQRSRIPVHARRALAMVRRARRRRWGR